LLELAKGSGPICGVTASRDVLCFAVSAFGGRRSERELPARQFLSFPGGARSVCTGVGGRVCYEANIVPTPALRGQVSRVSVSSSRGCALLRDGGIACWSWSATGRPTRRAGRFVDVLAGPEATCALAADGKASCWSNESEAEVVFTGATDLSLLASFPRADVVCGLDRAGQVRCASSSKLGAGPAWRLPPPPPGPLDDLSERGGQFCGLTRAGAIQCWGRLWPGPEARP
jgi:hypothetical protein